jgi:hypothetical protein
MGHGDMLLVLLSPRSSSEQFGAGARPVHPILGPQLGGFRPQLSFEKHDIEHHHF